MPSLIAAAASVEAAGFSEPQPANRETVIRTASISAKNFFIFLFSFSFEL
jgi:hypothetical protein